MNRIAFPLKRGNQGPQVTDLQDALQQCLDRGALLSGAERARRELTALLQRERAGQQYGDGVAKLVDAFQREHRLGTTGDVDEATAKELNNLLQQWGLLGGQAQRSDASQVVAGGIRREDGLPMSNVVVRALHESREGPIRLGEDRTDAEGHFTIRYQTLPGVDAIQLRISATSEDGNPLASSDLRRNARPIETIDVVVPVAAALGTQQRIEGKIVLEHGTPAEKMKLRLYRRDFGGKATLLDEATTLAAGRYAFSYNPGSPSASLEVRAVNATGEEVLLTKPLNVLTAESRSRLNLVAPRTLQPLAAEYRRLTADLTPHVGRMELLADAKEDAVRQDFTALNRASGWDARLITMASMAEKLAADPTVKAAGLSSETVYGLLRGGLPSDKVLLAQVGSEAVGRALKKVRDAGIVEMTDGDIVDAQSQFNKFADRARLDLPAPGSRSTYASLLESSGIGQAGQEKFASVYLNHRGTGAQLWDDARRAGLEDGEIKKLQLQGKFAFLAGNSEGMTARLLGKGVSDPVELVAQDLYTAAAWKAEVLEQANVPPDRRSNLSPADRQSLDALIPASYTAATVESRLDSYAEDSARKYRLSYPTQVLGRLIETSPHFAGTAAESTKTLLKTSTGKGFRFGETPVATFLKANPGVQGNLSSAEFQTAGREMQVLQRVYQISPGADVMPVLMSLNMSSAFDVMAYTESQFLDLFNSKWTEIYGQPAPPSVAYLVWRKSEQVSSITYNLFTIAKKMSTEPGVAAVSAPVEVRETVKDELIKHYPTMESLFGSLDYCECEHCRSVLSPAAYLVDLLQFVDIEPGVWGNFLAQWKATHGGQDYPHKDAAGAAMKPYDVLKERRPDLPHISLTCENTNTVLPYIDIVNEILEYFLEYTKLDEKVVHDTGDTTSEELLAEPQNIVRGAYDKLRSASYPVQLPFDLWIETVREFCGYFETPFHHVLEALRPADTLFAAAQPFDRSAIFHERLRISSAEAVLFHDPNPLAKWHELYGYANPADATNPATDPDGQRIDLNSAKALSRRLGATYKEIAEIIRTRFVNPELSKLSVLYKLGVSIADARTYLADKVLIPQVPATLNDEQQKRRLEAEAFKAGLEKLALELKVTEALLEAALQAIAFNRVLVLFDEDAGCNFDKTIVHYADATPANPIDFLRINLFVRLWRKLGWTIEETDRALSGFVPRSTPYDATPANLAKQPLRTALIYIAHLDALESRLKPGKQGRMKLLALWSDIDTTGKKPLYAQLFLTPSVLKAAPVFDHPLGKYLQFFDAVANEYKPFRWNSAQPEDPATGNVSLGSNILALQGALGLTADEIGPILVDAGKTLAAAELSLANVSLLYRYGLLAKALKLSVAELISLKQLSGLDPFKALHADPLDAIDQDHPFSQTMEFVTVAEEVKDSGFKAEDLEFLLRHRFDATGEYRANREGTLNLLKSLAEGVRAITLRHAVPADPAALSDEDLQQKLGLALPSEVVTLFTSMMNGTAESTVTRPVLAADQLRPSDFTGDPTITVLKHNTTRNEQTLVCRGILFAPQKASLVSKYTPRLSAAQNVTLAALLDDAETKSQQIAHAFFDKHLLKQTLPASGFLDNADFDLLFAPPPPGMTEEALRVWWVKQSAKRRARLALAFLPYLQQLLIRQLIVQTMIAQTGGDPVMVESLVTDERLIASPKALLDVFAAVGSPGVSASFFAAANGTGPALAAAPAVTTADTVLNNARDGGGNPIVANSARFEGYLEVPVAGAYRFLVELGKQNAKAELRFPHLADPVFLKGSALAEPDTLGKGPTEFLELKPGVLYRFSLDLADLGGGQARLHLHGETIPKGPLSQLVLYAASALDAAQKANTLLAKALDLTQALGVSEREIRYLLTHRVDFDDLSLSELPSEPASDLAADLAAVQARFRRFRRLASYARLKRGLAEGTDDLIGIFEANGTAAADRLTKLVYPQIAKLTRRDEATIKATAEALFAAPGFASEIPLWRLWDALQVVEHFGVPPASIVQWTSLAGAAATADQRFAIAREVKEALKARFEPETWRRVVQPIFDKLRQRQRDALAARVMHLRGFDRLEQLYEYFLIDPGMEPVVQTSRIRLAISSLQLFVQRSLLNLERKVHPSVLNARQWEWMKRYRVWEANRKIFLFPENWLEPEFRDDKTHLFSELESALFEGDVSSDMVEDAFLNYLKKLDELARLDIVAMHIEDSADPAMRKLHVFGRTFGQSHKYFYRRFAHEMWTAWEPVTAEIEGDHLAPIVWRDRLYLFWVTFTERAKPAPVPAITVDYHTAITVPTSVEKELDAHLHWSEYLNGQWKTKESGEFEPLPHQKLTAIAVPRSRIFIHVSKEPYENGEERGVFIHLGWPFNQAFYLAGRNASPERGTYGTVPGHPFYPKESPYSTNATRYMGSIDMRARFASRITTSDAGWAPGAVETPAILQQSGIFSLLPCDNDLTAVGISEEAYQNASNPAAVKAALERGAAGLAELMKPVFYQDNWHNFFVMPDVTETTSEEWEEWVTQTPQPESGWHLPGWWEQLEVVPEIQWKPPIPGPDPTIFDPGSLINPGFRPDWVINPGSVIKFGDRLIGPTGQPGIEMVTNVLPGVGAVGVSSGGDIPRDTTVVVSDEMAFAQSGLAMTGGGLNVVGDAGFNAALRNSVQESTQSGFGMFVTGLSRPGRTM